MRIATNISRLRGMLLASLMPSLCAIPAHADNVSWNVDASGLWTTPSNWTPGLPGPNDDVIIDRPSGNYAVTLSDSASIHSLFSAEPLTLYRGTLTAATTLQMNNTLTLTGSTLIGGTLSSGLGGILIASSASSINGTTTLSGITLASPLTAGAGLVILNNMTFSGATVLYSPNSSGSTLSIPGSQILSGSGTLSVGVSMFGTLSAGSLTISPGVTVLLPQPSNDTAVIASSITNAGVFVANPDVTNFGNNPANSGTFTNQGTLTINNYTSFNMNLAGTNGVVQIRSRFVLNSPMSGTLLFSFDGNSTTSIFQTSGPITSGATLRTDQTGYLEPTNGSNLVTNHGVISLAAPGKTLLVNALSPIVPVGGGDFISDGTISGPGNISFADNATISGTYSVTGTTTVGPSNGPGSTSTLIFSPGIYVLGNLLLPYDASHNAKVDITFSRLILGTVSSSDKNNKLATLKTYILAAGSNWQGKSGITSSAAANDPQHYAVGLFDNALLDLQSLGGQPLKGSDLLISLAHIGDANENGIVDIQDQSLVTNHWQSAQNNWAAGDLNLDGFVDLQDLTLVTNNWQQQSSPFSQLPITNYQLPPTPTPEPASLLLTLPLLFTSRRKRFRHALH